MGVHGWVVVGSERVSDRVREKDDGATGAFVKQHGDGWN